VVMPQSSLSIVTIWFCASETIAESSGGLARFWNRITADKIRLARPVGSGGHGLARQIVAASVFVRRCAAPLWCRAWGDAFAVGPGKRFVRNQTGVRPHPHSRPGGHEDVTTTNRDTGNVLQQAGDWRGWGAAANSRRRNGRSRNGWGAGEKICSPHARRGLSPSVARPRRDPDDVECA